MSPRRSPLPLCLALLVALAGCAAPSPPLRQRALPPPPALVARLWLATDAAALLAALPPQPLALPDPPPASPDPSLLAAWREPASRWVAAELRAIRADSLPPTFAARALMLLGAAMSDALTLAADARAAGREVSDHAAVAEAAARVMALTHPRRAALPPAELEAAIWAGVWRGEASATGVFNGRHLGAAVAAAALSWAAADGSAEGGALALVEPAPGVWSPTAPGFEQPLAPAWGRVRTLVVGDPARLRAAAPPAWGSPGMEAQLAAFAEAQGGLTAGQLALARRWAGGAGTVTPPGLWMQTALDLAAARRLAPAEAAGLYAALGAALHDAAVVCWETKYHYMVPRPIQAMRGREPGWLPALTTPPHPSYPSGHAAFSGAASAILARAFPDEAEALRAMAAEAAGSRVYGGIHWPMDGEAGLAQGARVAELVLAAPARPTTR